MRTVIALVGGGVLALLAAGCAITDYEGFPEHRTVAEAKLWAQEIAFTGSGDPELDGTYSYTVSYENYGGHDPKMRIFSYRNPVSGSFSRDGQIDRDGDDVQGHSGILGGKFLTQWVVIDPATGCQFFDNTIQLHGHPPPPISLCATTNEEIDRDFELQASFASTGDLLAQIWSGAVRGGFTVELTGLRLGGVEVPLAEAFSIGSVSNGMRPTRLAVDLSQPAADGLIQAILSHTADGEPTTLGLAFAGGMSLDLPSDWRVVFNHAALQDLL